MEDEEPLTADVKNAVNFFNSLNKKEHGKPKPKPKPNVKKLPNYEVENSFKGKISSDLRTKAKVFNQNVTNFAKNHQQPDEVRLIRKTEEPGVTVYKGELKQPDIVLEVNKITRSEDKIEAKPKIAVKPVLNDSNDESETINSKNVKIPGSLIRKDIKENLGPLGRKHFAINENVGANVQTHKLKCGETSTSTHQIHEKRKTNLKLIVNKTIVETEKILTETKTNSNFVNPNNMAERISSQNFIQKSKSFDEFNSYANEHFAGMMKNCSVDDLVSSATTKTVVDERSGRFVESFKMPTKQVDAKNLNVGDKVRVKKSLKRKNSATVVEPYNTYVIKSDSFKNGVVIESAPSPNIVRKTSSKKKGIYRKIQVHVKHDENIR